MLVKHLSERDDEVWINKAKEGATKFMVLFTLSQEPVHGYELMKRIRNWTNGWLKSTSGSVYPVLRELEKQGLVKGIWVQEKGTARMKKRYYITSRGLEVLEKMIEKRRKVARLFRAIFNEMIYGQKDVDYSTIISQTSLDANEIEQLITFLKLKKERIEMLLQKLNQIKEQIKQVKNE